MQAIDPKLLRQAEEYIKEDDVIWDVGANIGLFSFAAASLAGSRGQVYAFDPDTWLVHALRSSAMRQPSSSAKVTTIPCAIGADNAIRSFAIAARARSANHLIEYGSSQTGGMLQQQTVVAVSLDWLLNHLPPPNLLKIDVEGAEIEVLGGARNLLEQYRPIVLCEVCKETSPWVTEFFHSQSYVLYDGELPSPRRKPLNAAPWSTIAVPVISNLTEHCLT